MINPIIEAFEKGIKKSEIKPWKIVMASDIPFEPEVVKMLGIDFFHTPRGRTLPFGTGLKLANPSLHVVCFVGDLMTLGGNHFVHTARRNMELVAICVNNFVYRKIGGQLAPLTPKAFSPYSTFEEPFNLPHLGNSCGAVYTARWTALHIEELADSIAEALNKRGFSVIEVLASDLNFYTPINLRPYHNIPLLNFYYKNSVVKNGEDPRNVGITPEAPIIVGKFTNKEKPTFIDLYNAQLMKALGDKFIPCGIKEKQT